MRHVPDYPLWLGHVGDVRDLQRLLALGVAAVVDLALDEPPVALTREMVSGECWLFAGDDRAGQTAATLYSLIASAGRHQVDPQRYLTSILAKLAITPAGELDRLLPDAWKAEDQADPVTAKGPSSATSATPPA